MVNGIEATLPDISMHLMVAAFTPEMVVGATAIVLLMGGVFAASKETDRLLLGLAMFVLAALLAMMCVSHVSESRILLFSNMFIFDRFSYFLKLLLIVSAFFTFSLSDGWLVRGDNQRFEFPVLALFALLGMMLMVSANDLMSLYLSLELSSLPLYVLAAFNRDSLKSTESGLKYFVLGALASGIILFGVSLVYGFAGSTNFDALGALFGERHPVSLGVLVGLVMVIVGLSFKISAAPFHMWTPDVYEGAPTPVTAYLSTASKIAAVGLMTRLLMQPFLAMVQEWQQVVVALAIASMLVGAFGALTQSNIKRLLAYSSIGHVGYALVGLAAGNAEGVSSVLIYFTLYMFMSAGAFACVLMMNRGGAAVESLADLAGLSRTRPRMAFALAVFMFSMAGIPPLAGFFGKLYVFLAAVHAGLVVLAVIGVLASVVACFYYLKIVKLMYFDEPAAPFDVHAALTTRWVLFACAAVIFLFILIPAPLIAQANLAAKALFL